LVKQTEAYNKLKTDNDTLNTEIVALTAKEFDATITDE
jgi:hypothetical protein